MNRLLKNNIVILIKLLLIIHIAIGFGFLLYNYTVTKNITYKYIIKTEGKNYHTNEVYYGDESIIFFNGFKATYESNRNTIKISKKYNIDTIGDKIIINL